MEMKRNVIKKTNMTSLYNELRVDSARFLERNDCAVVAVAAVAGVSYAEAHRALEAQGRRKGQGTYMWQTENALKALGKKMTQLNLRTFIDQYPGVHRNLKNVTTHHPRRFPKVFDPNKRYLFRTARHILAVMGGEVNDWTVNRAMQVVTIHEVN
jgi:hypothetical protein